MVGGGLTAVQVSQLAMKKGCKVTLVSRRPLTSRHFDVSESWFDRRYASGHHHDFFDKDSFEKRVEQIKAARGGGSVPPLYMDEICKAEAKGAIVIKVGEIQVAETL